MFDGGNNIIQLLQSVRISISILELLKNIDTFYEHTAIIKLYHQVLRIMVKSDVKIGRI